MGARGRRGGGRGQNAALDRIELWPPDPAWASGFEAEALRIRRGLPPGFTFQIEHFGSTAVPGLGAKPVIDLMLIVPDRAWWPRLIVPIEALGYVAWNPDPHARRMFFVRGLPPFGERRTHHLHVRTPDDSVADLLFRDHLRRNPDVARRYEHLKRELSKRFRTDREGYTAGKTAFILAELRAAGFEGDLEEVGR